MSDHSLENPGHLHEAAAMIDRRGFALGSAAALLMMPACGRAEPIDAAKRLAAIEKAAGGRLGVCIMSAGRPTLGWRAGERFALCSTFKLSLAALALREAEAGRVALDETIAYTRADLLPNSPETEKHVAEGRMTIEALALAAQLYSDNCAGNLLLKRFGGPAGLTRFWREIGDSETRLDHFETRLNRVQPGEVQDTTTPAAMARNLARLLSGDVLTPPSRVRLKDWMAQTATGMKRIRGALPPGWSGGDKTGTASYAGLAGKINDIAVLYPPDGRAPVIVTAYYEAANQTDTMRPEDEAVLRQVGEVAVAWAS